PRRLIESSDLDLLARLSERYVRAVHARTSPGVFAELGRDLYQWLDGDQGQLTELLDRARPPVAFAVAGPRSPSAPARAAPPAPSEPLPGPAGPLAEAQLMRFSVARRLGPAEPPPALDGYGLGLAFMASSPRSQHELDYEAEEAAILRAVGETRLDLL